MQWFVKPISHGPGALCNFVVTVTGIDLNDLSEEDLMRLKEATHKYKAIVIKIQHNLEPIKHWEFIARLDPTAAPVHGHGTGKDFKKTGGFLSVRLYSHSYFMIKSPNCICIPETRSNWYPIRSKCPLDRVKATKAPTPTVSKTSPLKAVRVMTGTNPLHPRPILKPVTRSFSAGTRTRLFTSASPRILRLHAPSNAP